MNHTDSMPSFTWTTGCRGRCPWSPSLQACSDGTARSDENVFAPGDPPCLRAAASPSASPDHNDPHFPLKAETWLVKIYIYTLRIFRKPKKIHFKKFNHIRSDKNKETKRFQHTLTMLFKITDSPCTAPQGYRRPLTILFPTLTSSVLPTTAKGRQFCNTEGKYL